MNFFDALAERDRTRLLNLSASKRLAPGDLLFAQGDTSRDLYLVADGSLDIVSQRGPTAVVVRTFTRGALVGEMSFLDPSYRRSMEVRSPEGAHLHVWSQATLSDLLGSDPVLGGVFYRFLAELLASRTRSTSSDALDGALKAASGSDHRDPVLEASAQRLLETLLQVRTSGGRDASAGASIEPLMDPFAQLVGTRLSQLSDEEAERIATPLRALLRPVLQRATTGELCYDGAHAASPELLSHVLGGQPDGAGAFGAALDAWMLARPTLRGLRDRRACAASLVLSCLPASPPWRVEVLHPGHGELVQDLVALTGHAELDVTIVGDVGDQAATDALLRKLRARAGGAIGKREALHVALDRFAFAPTRRRGQDVQLIVIDGLLEYLPDRAAASLLRGTHARLSRGGRVLATSVREGPDDAFLRHFLNWPMIRRSGAELEGLFASVGFGRVHAHAAGGSGVVVEAEA